MATTNVYRISTSKIIEILKEKGFLKKDQTISDFLLSPAGNQLIIISSRFTVEQEVFLDKQIADFDISVRALRCMREMGFKTFREVIEYTYSQLKAKHKDLGQKTLSEIVRLLDENNLSLKKE